MNAVTEVMDELRKALALVDQLGNARDKAECELAELQRRTSEALAQAVEWQRERDEARDALFRADQDALRVEEERDRLRDELAEANARRGDLRTALQWANEERDRLREQLAAKHSECPDCAMYAERSARFAEQADQLMRERDEAREEAAVLADDLYKARFERDEARRVLSEILALWPYLNCACGRNKPRLSEALREAAKKATT
jgi:chromosome segregation ATPase